jgi:hypothetical protein
MPANERARKAAVMIFPMLSRKSPATISFETKEVFVALPFVGSAIAMSWEVGSFIPISGVGGRAFGLFSLSEHLLFAIEALPMALVVAALLPVLIAGVSSSTPKRRSHRVDGRSTRIGLRIAFAILAFFGMAVGALGIYERISMLLVLSGTILSLTTAFALYPPAMFLLPKQLFVAAVGFAMATAMALGVDQTRGLLNLPEFHTVRIVVNDVAKEAVLLRTGERGLLIYEPNSRRFAFTKWDAVKGVDWPRRPIAIVQ